MLSLQLINEFIAILGEENVTTNNENIKEAETATYTTTVCISLIVSPRTVPQLQQCIGVANKYKQPVYTVSQGKNWGYGSRVPVTDNNVLIELKHLNRILDFDEKQAYITIEPGVTFNDVFSFLREKKSELIVSTIGGAGSASLIGNALERGIGTGLYADRFNFVCGLEVLLPNGDMIATGFERYGNFKTGKLFRWGSGPSLDGIFSQSNLGIVTKMTIWLMKVPQHLSLLFYRINDTAKLQQAIDKLQTMVMEGLVRPTITLYNDMRLISSAFQYPFQQTNGQVIPPDMLVKQIRASVPAVREAVSDWNGEINIRSVNAEQAELTIRLIKERLEDVAEHFTVVHASKEEILSLLQNSYHKTEAAASPPSLSAFLIKKYIGIPDDSVIRQTYWRKRKPLPADLNPDRDKCGLIWICPVVPFDGDEVGAVIKIITEIVQKYYFEPAISFQCTSERCINVIASFNWDREVASEDETAEKCFFETKDMLHQKGYFSYRDATLSMKEQHAIGETSYTSFLSELKKAIDPNNILSPSRYISI